MSSEENYTGCLLCVRGLFICGEYPQDVKCEKHGLVKERQECPDFQGQPIAEVDPENLP